MIDWFGINVYTYSFIDRNIIGRQMHDKFWSCLSLCNKSPCAYVHVNAFKGHFLWRFCDVFTDSIHNTNPWNCLVLKKGFKHDINTTTSFVRIDFRIQDWANFRILTNPRFRGCVYSRHAVCISSDPSSIVMKKCPFQISFEKPASEHSFDNFCLSRSSANFRSYSCNKSSCANDVELWDMALALGNLSRYHQRFTYLTFGSFVPFTLYIDMKMILPWNCSGSHLNSAIIFWISSRIPNVVNPGKFYHSNSIGSLSIRSKSLR